MTASSAPPAGASGGCASVADPEHAWNRGFLFWQLLFGMSLVIGLVVIALSSEPSAHRWISAAAIAVMATAYLILRPQSVDGLTFRNGSYLLVMIAAVGVACAAQSSMSLLLTVAFSQVWLFTGPIREGVAATTLLTVAALGGLLTRAGWTVDAAATLGTIMLISLVLSIGFGIWISRIIDQSRDRADLIRELEATRSQLGEAHHAQGVMAERERVAREIHDTLAQGYTSVIMLAQSARAQLERSPLAGHSEVAGQLASIEDVARENLAEARALVAAFSPVALEDSSLADAVTRLAARFEAETGLAIAVELPADPAALAGLSREREVVLLRAVQESLANVRRHAQATRVAVRLVGPGGSGESASAEVTDNGVGFASGSDAVPAGYGLSGMRHRVQDAGGHVDVESSPGAGTRVTVRVPA